jgi:hypothetical protein
MVTYHELNDLGVELSTNRLTSTNGPANLSVWNTTSMIISNLDFDTTYRVRIAGRDLAGNIGPEVVVTGETVRFVVTQGLARVETTYSTSNQVDVYWLASSNKVYDVLYTDSPSLQDNLTSTWKLLSTVTNSWMFDNGGTGPDGDVRIGPSLNQHTIRFYRVSRKDVWRTNVSPRRASVEVYAAKPIRLVPGENWVSLCPAGHLHGGVCVWHQPLGGRHLDCGFAQDLVVRHHVGRHDQSVGRRHKRHLLCEQWQLALLDRWCGQRESEVDSE